MNETHAGKSITGGVVRYALLPGLLPRVLNIFHSGFRLFAYYIASIFGSVRIFQPSHPYLQAQNFKKFGLINVLAEGARSITWDRKHLDQIAAYLIIITAFITFLVQFTLMAGALMMDSAFAIPNDMITDIGGAGGFDFLFVPTVPEQDYALRFLDLVFGLQNITGTAGFFESCVGTATVCNDASGQALAPYTAFPSAMHTGFHSMIAFYNYTIIALAFVILLYYVVTMTAETAINGTMWGQRGNKTWIPVRVIFFAALIMPFYQGFNLAQIITLNAAYYGTGMASNAWREVNIAIAEDLAGDHDTLIAPPNRSNFPSSVGLVRFMSLVKTCKHAEEQVNGRVIDAYIVTNRASEYDNCENLSTGPPLGTGPTSYNNALELSNYGDIRIRFGQRIPVHETTAPSPYAQPGEPVPCNVANPATYAGMPKEYGAEPGFVIPYCGEIVLTGSGPEAISSLIKAGQYNLIINNLWNDPLIDEIGQGFTHSVLPNHGAYEPEIREINNLIRGRDEVIAANIINAVDAAIAPPSIFDVDAALTECGWMCAALYYNRIAEANGLVQGAVFNMPDVRLYPAVIEEVMQLRNTASSSSAVCDMMNPELPGAKVMNFSKVSDLLVATAINNTYEYYCNSEELGAGVNQDRDIAFRQSMGIGKNPVIDTIVSIFGLSGLFDMRQQTGIHPLAQLSILGNGMVNSTIIAFGGTAIGSAMGFQPIKEAVGKPLSGMIQQMTGVMATFGMIGLTIGFVLFYVLPYLPFIYFMFAVANWVKAIFEAMVGLPLWALAHLQLDGEGIIGDGASSGYWLILEILIRPILILMGFLGSISIFMAMVKVLNDMFDLVVANIGGFAAFDAVEQANGRATPGNQDPFDLDDFRGPIDQFFYTVIYAIIVYMMALTSFKLIDSIPNQILRWAGVAAKTFGDFQHDQASEIMGLVGTGVKATAALGGGALGRIGGGNKQLRENVGVDDD